jgi:hypothetical protein
LMVAVEAGSASPLIRMSPSIARLFPRNIHTSSEKFDLWSDVPTYLAWAISCKIVLVICARVTSGFVT